MASRFLSETGYNMYWQFANGFLWIMLYSMFLTIKYVNLTNFLVLSMFTSFILMVFLIFQYDFSPNADANFLFWFMFVLSIITLTAFMRSAYLWDTIMNSKAPQGKKGVDGPRGIQGETLDSDLNMCYNQAVEKVEQMIREAQTQPFDENTNLFKNLYLKRELKRICDSKHYKSLKASYGHHYQPTKLILDDVEKSVNHLLSYENGKRFLENHFYTDHDFQKELLVPNELESPFLFIKKQDYWNYK